LGFLAGATLIHLFPYIVDLPASMWFPLFAVLFALTYSVNTINHNVIHLPISSRPRVNRFFECWISVLQGHSSHRIWVPHCLNHHIHFRDEKDWMRPDLAGAGPGLVQILRYIGRSLSLGPLQDRTPPPPPLSKSVQAAIAFEQKLILAVWIILALCDWKVFLVFTFASQFVAVCTLMGMNLLQHEHCDLGSEKNHSRNFTGRFANWFLFNGGFHSAHHLRPTAHWSEMPDIHRREIAPGLAPELDQRSLFLFLMKNYLFAYSGGNSR
jgi:fatty acid desaturase